MNLNPRFAWFVTGGFLCSLVKAAPPAAGIVAGLSDDSFQKREQAQGELLRWARQHPEAAKGWLLERSRDHGDPESRRRCLAVLRDLVLQDYFKQGKGYAGITMQGVPLQLPMLPRARFGIRITMVMPDSPAAKAGLLPGALIVGVNDQQWDKPAPEAAFSEWVQARAPGSKVTLKLLEGDKIVDRPLVLGRRPEGADQGVGPGDHRDLERREREARAEFFNRWLEQRSARP